MKTKLIIMFSVNLIITFGLILIVSNDQKAKIGYVQSNELIYGYEGTREAMSKFSNEKVQWQKNIDTLKIEFDKEVKNYRSIVKTLNPKQRGVLENKISNQEQQLKGYKEAIAKKIQEEDQKLLAGIVNQINSFTNAYGKENGYDMILGTSSEGNLIYAKEGFDLTNKILEEMNKNYLGK